MLDEVINEELSHLKIAGGYQSFSALDNGVRIATEDSIFDVLFYAPDIVRVHRHKEHSDTNPYSVIQTPQEVKLDVNEEGAHLIISSEVLSVQVQKDPIIFTFLTKDGSVINQDDDGLGTITQSGQTTVYKKLQEGERFVGLGEKTGPLDRRGHGYQNWNTDHFAYGPESDPIYASIPFYIGIHHGMSYGIFLDNSYKSFFNFGASNNRFSSFSMDGGDLDYYFFSGTVAEIVMNYTWLTGRIQLPPLWSIGYQQCRYSYYPDSEVLDIAQKFREKDIPADVMVLDIHHMDGYKIFAWDPEKFPDPKRMVSQLREMGFETTVICDPGIKIQEGYDPYESGVAEDIFVKYPDQSYYEGEVWPGWCHFPDFTKKEAREWWSKQLANYSDAGVKGYWNDMNEIATWGQMLPENILFEMDGEGATSRKARNIYGFKMTQASVEAAKDKLAGQRPFILTRAGFSGVQRYSALWTGDNVANDEHMLLGVRLVNSLGLSGVSFAGYDVGGFVENGHSHLFARWIQLGAFSPFFRGHSMINSKDSEPWSYGEEVEEIAANYIRLRYQLLPYLYQAFHQAYLTGLPVARSLVFDYTHDDRIYQSEFENQYLFGDRILVAPISSSEKYLKSYLPSGEWYSFFTDEKWTGDQQLIREYELTELPLFIKASSIVPMYPEVGSHTKEIGEVLALHVYKGSEETSIQYYEDDGVTYGFESGSFHERRITFHPNKNSIVVNTAKGSYESKMKRLQLVLHGFERSEVDDSYKETMHSFVKPISHFDPIEPPAPHRLKSNVFVHEVDYHDGEMKLSW